MLAFAAHVLTTAAVLHRGSGLAAEIGSSIGTPLTLDTATNGRTRSNMAKVRVEVNLLKKLPDSIWVGIEDENSPLKGYAKKIEHEAMLKYYVHCKKMGHNMINCRVLERKRVMEKEITNKEQIEENSNNIKGDDGETNGKQGYVNNEKNHNNECEANGNLSMESVDSKGNSEGEWKIESIREDSGSDKIENTCQSTNKQDHNSAGHQQSQDKVWKINNIDTSISLATDIKNIEGIQLVVDIDLDQNRGQEIEPLDHIKNVADNQIKKVEDTCSSSERGDNVESYQTLQQSCEEQENNSDKGDRDDMKQRRGRSKNRKKKRTVKRSRTSLKGKEHKQNNSFSPSND
ncbi:hypothetical protein HAX54_001870 [Datura stramonium]|uniref:Uncharacterized protein n=1 Tax=Datura stramonium TaxID=4076 RepID=A0ABS8T4J6_DATST|nr:hypothetical protein [Datura stramonium]